MTKEMSAFAGEFWIEEAGGHLAVVLPHLKPPSHFLTF